MSFQPLRSPVARSMVATAAMPSNDDTARDNAASAVRSPAVLGAPAAALCGSNHTAREVALPTGVPAEERKVTTRFPRAGRADMRVRTQPPVTAVRATTLPRNDTVAVAAARGARARTAPKNASKPAGSSILVAAAAAGARPGCAAHPRRAGWTRASALPAARPARVVAAGRSRSKPFRRRDLRCGVVPESVCERRAGRTRRRRGAQRRLEITGGVVLALHRVRPAAPAGRLQRGGRDARKQRRRRAQDGRIVCPCTRRREDGDGCQG